MADASNYWAFASDAVSLSPITERAWVRDNNSDIGKLIAMPSKTTRRLIWIPVVHSQADLGTMSESVRQLHVQRVGQGQWHRHVKNVDEMWRNIHHNIDRLDLDYSKVRLYQDGLPDCGRDAEIVRELAQAGSRNHRILLDLIGRGAKLTGTESPELLLKEYELARQVLISLQCSKDTRLAERQMELSKALLDKRDRFIAERIGKTLRGGETGLIFLGVLHSLDGLLPPDIELTYLRHAHRAARGNSRVDPQKQRRQSR